MCFTSVNYSGHTHKYTCSAINYLELSELGRDSTTANKNPFLHNLALDFPMPVWEPLPGRGGHRFFGALGTTATRCMAGKEIQQGKVPAFPSSQPPLISAEDKILGKRELRSGQAQLLLSPWVGEESLGTSEQLESKRLKFLQKKFCVGASPEELQLQRNASACATSPGCPQPFSQDGFIYIENDVCMVSFGYFSITCSLPDLLARGASSPGLVQRRTEQAGGATCSKGELGESLKKNFLVAGGHRHGNR